MNFRSMIQGYKKLSAAPLSKYLFFHAKQQLCVLLLLTLSTFYENIDIFDSQDISNTSNMSNINMMIIYYMLNMFIQ
jgi:hypothetical protein